MSEKKDDVLEPIPYLETGTYQHYKGGLYTVIGIGRDEATLKPVVVYLSQTDNELWVRPYAAFVEPVTNEFFGYPTPRFMKVYE